MSVKHLLYMPEYKYWYDAIRKDDLEAIDKELNTADDKEQERLLHGTFNFSEVKNRDWKENSISNVWHLVAALCSKKTI